MQTTFALLALAAAASVVSATTSSAYTETLTATGSAPSGCATSYSGSFEITVVTPSSKKRDVVQNQKRDALVATLSDAVLTDAEGRIGGIVANGQFQFDGPPSQAGTLYNKGWSVCSNGSLALGSTAVWYECLSGDFYNLYYYNIGAQCTEVLIDIIPVDSSSGVTTASDGQVTAASAATQYTDGQVQAESATPIAQITDGQIQASSAGALPVSQYTDGQLQVTSNPPTVTVVAQITDGQIQASSAAAVTTSAASVTAVAQISDGQIQASASATTLASTGAVSNKTTSATTVAYTGAANSVMLGSELLAAAVGVAAMAML